jgi:hypothetical protein
MTPEKLAAACLDDIKRVREMHGDGPAGYVLTTKDGTNFLCQARDALLRLDVPHTDELVVLVSEQQALSMRRLWNRVLAKGSYDSVDLALRGEALDRYVRIRADDLMRIMGSVDVAG